MYILNVINIIFLQGVVIVEEFERAKVVLERDDTSSDLKVDTLQKIGLKNPSKEILLKTQLGIVKMLNFYNY